MITSATLRRAALIAAMSCQFAAPLMPAAWAQDVGDPAVGRAIAERWCSNCHVFPGSSHATATGAPSFSAVAADSAVTPLSLRAFLQTPHDRMPDLHLTNDEMDDLIAFVLSFRGK